MKRRTLLKGGLGLGALGAAGALGRYGLLAPPASARLEPVDAMAVRVFDALPDEARHVACMPYDHPLRQYYNRGLQVGGLTVSATSLNWSTRRALTDLLHAGLSETGRSRVPSQDMTYWTGVNLMQLLFCGDPRSGPYQVTLSGVHLNLRLGGRSAEGVAFGGPQVYGDQRGNGVVGLPGNTYLYQLEAARRLRAALRPAQRAAARVKTAPAQTLIGLQGAAGHFDGVPLAELGSAERRLARELIDGILGTYAEADAAYAWQCLERNGGIEALHFADYDVDFEGGRRAGDGPSQIFRLEGPAAVFHFRGEPHVHAFAHVAMDAERPLGVGARVGDNPATLEGDSLKTFFETAMRAQAGADAALYPTGGVVGRLRAGEVRTGDVWVAESWVDELVAVEIRGADLAPSARDALRARGIAPQASTLYRIATTLYIAREETAERLGRVRARHSLGLLRDALVAHATAHGFATS
jgi:Protein of unknown function (DUF3500)/5'-nucleotidase, C-terminal domain